MLRLLSVICLGAALVSCDCLGTPLVSCEEQVAASERPTSTASSPPRTESKDFDRTSMNRHMGISLGGSNVQGLRVCLTASLFGVVAGRTSLPIAERGCIASSQGSVCRLVNNLTAARRFLFFLSFLACV